MKHPKLFAEKRTVLGKKIKKLRREGLLPANIYGKDTPSTALQVKMSDFIDLYKEVGETGIIDLEFDGKTNPVLIKSVQINYQQHQPLHADFYKVNLKEKIKAMIPVTTVGEPQAVTDKLGTLLQPLSEVEVEALPERLPDHLEVNIEHLAAVDDQITVSDLKAPEDVTILTDPAQTVVKIAELVAPEPEPEPEATPEEGGEVGAETAAADEERPAESSTEEAPKSE